MIQLTQIRVDDEGDETTGLFPQFWTIDGDVFLNTETELRQFEKQLTGAFSLAAKRPRINYKLTNVPTPQHKQ